MVMFSHLELQFVDVLSVFLLLRRVLGDFLAFGRADAPCPSCASSPPPPLSSPPSDSSRRLSTLFRDKPPRSLSGPAACRPWSSSPWRELRRRAWSPRKF